MTDRSAEHVIREAIAQGVTAFEGKPHWGDVPTEWEVDAILATRIPQACQTCGGAEFMLGSPADDGSDDGLPCPDCPTVGTLLLYGWNVATAERIYNDDWSLWGTAVNGQWVGNEDTLAALREMPVSKLTQEPT